MQLPPRHRCTRAVPPENRWRGPDIHPSDRENRFVMCVLAVARTSPSSASVAVRICSAIVVFTRNCTARLVTELPIRCRAVPLIRSICHPRELH